MFEYQSNNSGRPLEGLDPRQQQVVETGDFLSVYADEICALLASLGKNDVLALPPRAWLPMIQNQWIGSEHGSFAGKEQYTDDQIFTAVAVLDSMGMLRQISPPAGHYDALLVAGGTTEAINNRLPWVDSPYITADQTVILAGQRPIDERRDGTRDELLSSEGRFGGRDISDDEWVQWALNGQRNLQESHMARVALTKRYGKVVLRKVGWGLDDENRRYPQDYHYMVRQPDEDLEKEIAILHGKAVNRERGDPRPTTASTTIEWLERFAPKKGSKEGSIMVLVAGTQPHLIRMVAEMKSIAVAMGRPDIEFVPAGLGMDNDCSLTATVHTALGEVGRLINRSPSFMYEESLVASERNRLQRDDRAA